MLLPLAAATLLVGLGSSVQMGEQSPAVLAVADVAGAHWRGEAQYDAAGKVETGDGWQGDIAAEYAPAGWLGVGARYSYRSTSRWSKQGLWLRVALRSGPLNVLAEACPNSTNREAKLSVRFRQCYGHLCGEARTFIETYSQSGEGSYGYGVAGLAGYAWN